MLLLILAILCGLITPFDCVKLSGRNGVVYVLLPRPFGPSFRCAIGTSVTIAVALTASAAAATAQSNGNVNTKKPKVLETHLGIKYVEVKKCAGPFPNTGDIVAIDFIAFLSNGTVFDSTGAHGRKYLSFAMGKKQVIEGLENVISYMQAGGEVTCTIPPQFAFGTKGICVGQLHECLVPPNETVKYVMKLKNVGVGYN